MASSKSLFFLLALFALVLLISSEVSATDDAAKSSMTANGMAAAAKGGIPDAYYKCRYGCCRGYRYRYGCKKCCGYPTQAPDAEFEDDHKN